MDKQWDHQRGFSMLQCGTSSIGKSIACANDLRALKVWFEGKSLIYVDDFAIQFPFFGDFPGHMSLPKGYLFFLWFPQLHQYTRTRPGKANWCL